MPDTPADEYKGTGRTPRGVRPEPCRTWSRLVGQPNPLDPVRLGPGVIELQCYDVTSLVVLKHLPQVSSAFHGLALHRQKDVGAAVVRLSDFALRRAARSYPGDNQTALVGSQVELASRRITVNCVAPGLIESDMTADLELEQALKMVPMNRIGKAAEVAAAVAFLMSDDASYITRQVLSVNGGLV